MIVNYTKANVWIVQHGKMIDAPVDAEGKQIQKQIFQGQAIKIVPGLNTIKDQIWDEISRYADVQQKLDNGILEIIEGPVTSKTKKQEKETIDTLDSYNVKKAISVTEAIMDVDVLNALKKKEKRPQVLKAIKDQITKVEEADEAFGKKE